MLLLCVLQQSLLMLLLQACHCFGMLLLQGLHLTLQALSLCLTVTDLMPATTQAHSSGMYQQADFAHHAAKAAHVCCSELSKFC